VTTTIGVYAFVVGLARPPSSDLAIDERNL